MPGHRPEAAAVVGGDAAHPRPVVLVAHGDADARVGYGRSFERAGCTAILAESVAESLTCLSRPWMPIDAVWLAIDLPDGRGETLLAIVRNTPRLSHIRMIAHIGLDQPARTADLAGYGAAGWVSGPAEWATIWLAVFPTVPGVEPEPVPDDPSPTPNAATRAAMAELDAGGGTAWPGVDAMIRHMGS